MVPGREMLGVSDAAFAPFDPLHRAVATSISSRGSFARLALDHPSDRSAEQRAPSAAKASAPKVDSTFPHDAPTQQRTAMAIPRRQFHTCPKAHSAFGVWSKEPSKDPSRPAAGASNRPASGRRSGRPRIRGPGLFGLTSRPGHSPQIQMDFVNLIWLLVNGVIEVHGRR